MEVLLDHLVLSMMNVNRDFAVLHRMEYAWYRANLGNSVAHTKSVKMEWDAPPLVNALTVVA